MNEFEMSRAHKNAQSVGNWILTKREKHNVVILQFWTIITEEQYNELYKINPSYVSHSSNHHRYFHKTEVSVGSFFMYKKDILMIRDIEPTPTYYRCPMNTRYIPGSYYYRNSKHVPPQTEADIASLLTHCDEIKLVRQLPAKS